MGRKYDYDYIVIGSGAAGETAALTAAAAGQKVAIVEAHKWGGLAPNFRDVPYAAALHFSHLYAEAVFGSRFGLSSANLRFNYPTAQNWRATATRHATTNLKKKFVMADIECVNGYAHFTGPHEISIKNGTSLTSNRFLIATGTRPADNGIAGTQLVEHLTPDTALTMERIPKAVMVVGGGPTGCEIAQYFAELGIKVLISELSARLMPKEDEEVGQTLERYFKEKLKINVLTQTRVVALEQDKLSKKVIFMHGGQEKAVRVDAIVLATGATPATDLGLENAGVEFSHAGIKVNKMLNTSAKHIAAAGSVIESESSGTTEIAAYEGALAAANSIGHTKNIANYAGFARMVNTFPQIAVVGKTEDDCIRRDQPYRKVLVPLADVAASNVQDFKYGFIKMLADRQRRILGATVMAPEAATVIQEISFAIRSGATVTDLATTPHLMMGWGELVKIAAKSLVR